MEPPNYYQRTIIFVGNLRFTIDSQRLRREFAQFGTIIFAEVIRLNHRSRGYGFVHFSTSIEANNAVIEMNGRVVCGRSLNVSIARSRENRNAHLADPNHPVTANIPMNQNNYQRRLFNFILIYIIPAGRCLHDLVQINPFTEIFHLFSTT